MTVRKLEYNYFNTKDRWGCQVKEVGKDEVTQIIEHPARGDGDRWHYDVYYENGDIIRLFYPNQVYYKTIENE